MTLRFHLSALALAACAAAQSPFPLSPQACFYRINQDSAQPPLILSLASLGVAPGQYLRIGSVGAFRYINGGQDNYRSLVGVFSASATLLASNLQQRVPDAIPAGPAFPSGGTYHGNLPMDIPQDFFASRNTWDDHVVVRVPAGATHLFLGVHDSLFGDNADPNGDFGATVAVVTPSLGGTAEHIRLLSSVGGAAPDEQDVKNAPPGALVATEVHHPVGFADGSLYVFVADAVPTGGSVPQVLPDLHVGNVLIVQFGVLPATYPWHDTWSLVAPAGLAGTTLIVQGGALVPTARNGLYETTHAHRFVLQ